MAKCGACNNSFASYNAYETHVCSKSGFTPSEVEHQDKLTNGRFSRQAAKAIERGAAE